MTWLRVLISRIVGLFGRGRGDDRLDEEIRAHLDLLAEENERCGMAPAEARQAARRAFGSVDRVREMHRHQLGLPFVDAQVHDVRFAVRLLERDRGFGVTAIFVLGLGIGVNNTLVTIFYTHTIKGLPVERPERVLFVSTLAGVALYLLAGTVRVRAIRALRHRRIRRETLAFDVEGDGEVATLNLSEALR